MSNRSREGKFANPEICLSLTYCTQHCFFSQSGRYDGDFESVTHLLHSTLLFQSKWTLWWWLWICLVLTYCTQHCFFSQSGHCDGDFESVWYSPTALNVAFSLRVDVVMVTFSVVAEWPLGAHCQRSDQHAEDEVAEAEADWSQKWQRSRQQDHRLCPLWAPYWHWETTQISLPSGSQWSVFGLLVMCPVPFLRRRVWSHPDNFFVTKTWMAYGNFHLVCK